MTRRLAIVWMIACGGDDRVVVTSAPAPSEAVAPDPLPAAEPARVDAYGDPLPQGARHRLGTARLRHPAEIADLAWIEGGTVLVSSAVDGGVRAWDGATGRRVRRFDDALGTALDASPGGDRLAMAGQGVRVADAGTGAVMWSGWPDAKVGAVAFSPDGSRLAVAMGDSVQVVRADTGEPLTRYGDHRDRITDLRWSDDGARLVSVDDAGLVCVRDGRTGALGTTFRLASGALPIRVLAFSPDHRHVVVGRDPVEVRDVATGEFLRDLTGYGPAEHGAFDGDALVMVHAGPPTTVVTWTLPGGRSEITWRDVASAVPTRVSGTRDGARIAIADATGRIALRRTRDGHRIDEHIGHDREVTAVAFAGPNVLWSAGDGGRVLRWDVPTGVPTPLPLPHSGGATSLSLSPDATRLLTGGWDGVAREWDVATLGLVRTLPAGAPAAVAWRADGVPVTFSAERGLMAWPAEGPVALAAPRTGVMAVDPTRTRATIPSGGGTVVVDLADGTVRKSLDALTTPAANVQAAAFSPDGQHIAYATADSRTWLLPVGDGPARLLVGPAGLVGGVAWSPDGKEVVTTHSDRAWRWDVASGAATAFLAGHDDFTTAAAWSPDGALVATASADGTILLWDAAP